MQSTLRKPLAAALLLSSAAALLAQPAAARERHHVEAAPAAPAIVHVSDDDRERWHRDHDRAGWRDEWRRDNRPPAISELRPEPGQLMKGQRATVVSATFIDALSGVDLGSVRLRLDGRDVTGHAKIDPFHILVEHDLRPGRHVAELVVRDRAGNVARRSWRFEVVGQGHERYGEGYGRRPGGWR